MRACANRTDADRENENALACLMTSLRTRAPAPSTTAHNQRGTLYNMNMSAHTNAKRNRNRGAGKAMVAAPAVAVLLMSASLMCAHAHASSPGNGTVSVTDEDLLKAVRQGTGDKARELAASKMANLTLAFRTPQRRLISATSGVSFVPLLAGPSYDLFEFGVLAGSGLRRWVQELGKRGIRWGHIWGFDSFKGMPELQRNLPLRFGVQAASRPERAPGTTLTSNSTVARSIPP